MSEEVPLENVSQHITMHLSNYRHVNKLLPPQTSHKWCTQLNKHIVD